MQFCRRSSSRFSAVIKVPLEHRACEDDEREKKHGELLAPRKDEHFEKRFHLLA